MGMGKELVPTLPGWMETQGKEPSVETHATLKSSPSPRRLAGVGSLQSRAHHFPTTPPHPSTRVHKHTVSLSAWVSR